MANTSKNLLILGAASDIAGAIALKFASEGWSLSLAARDTNILRTKFSSDPSVAPHIVGLYSFDALAMHEHNSFYKALPTKPDAVIIAYAFTGPHDTSSVPLEIIEQIITTNYTGIVSIANIIKQDFLDRGTGSLTILSSVAGERAKGKNYYYGASKAALSYYIDGLRHELAPTDVHILHVKPGFIKTKMLPAFAPKLLTALPVTAADDIYQAIINKKEVLYTPWYWRWILMVYRLLPDSLLHN
jgi:short-subunit dehydrogenase